LERVETGIQTIHGVFTMICYEDGSGLPDFALVHGNVSGQSRVITRVQSECLTGHVFHSLSCDCYEQLHDSLKAITCEARGVLIYLRQEGRGIGLSAKMRSYILQRQGLDTVEANVRLGYGADERTYDAAARILQDLEVQSIVLLTNNPEKDSALRQQGVSVVEVIGVPPTVREQNKRYLTTKVVKMGHRFVIPT